MKKILLGLTTSTDWRSKIKEIIDYEIEEIALFLTMVNKEERKELYKMLENSSVKSIPHVHLRNDMDIDEMNYLINRYNTQAFNLHSDADRFPFTLDYSKYAKIMYIENADFVPTEKEIEKYGGVCADFSHWEDWRLQEDKKYFDFLDIIRKHKVGCSHISAVKDKIYLDEFNYKTYVDHKFKYLSEFDYIKKYTEFLPDLISIELENSIKEQIEVKKYLEKIINF